MGFSFDMPYYQYLIITTRLPLAINIEVQRQDINVALGILRWVISLFEFT